MIKRRAKKSLHTKPVKGKAKAKPALVAKTKARQRKRIHRVARSIAQLSMLTEARPVAAAWKAGSI